VVVLVFRARLRSIERKRLAERRILETELANLRTQVNPHFLFNSFNTLLNMIESKPAKAGQYLQRLSDFYRRILSANDEQLNSLKEELINLEEYLYLQEQRFGDALEVRIQVDNKWLSSKLPTLTLQLLAENAIKHNVVSKNKPLKIHIYTEGKSLILRNNRSPKRKAEPGTGTGLRNIKSRYSVMFKKEIIMDKSDSEFTVKLPLIEK
jgi:LytS/YehU family sensor histidine kinase